MRREYKGWQGEKKNVKLPDKKRLRKPRNLLVLRFRQGRRKMGTLKYTSGDTLEEKLTIRRKDAASRICSQFTQGERNIFIPLLVGKGLKEYSVSDRRFGGYKYKEYSVREKGHSLDIRRKKLTCGYQYTVLIDDEQAYESVAEEIFEITDAYHVRLP